MGHADVTGLPVKSAAVIGAGTMGSGITMALLNAGIPVVLLEQNKKAGIIENTLYMYWTTGVLKTHLDFYLLFSSLIKVFKRSRICIEEVLNES